MDSTCRTCKAKIEEWNEACGSCGFRLVLEPEEQTRAKFLRGPSLGALLFTQGWAFGSRLYLWFALSLIPIVGFVVLFVLLIFGRRLSWTQGGWASWEEFRSRMNVLDVLGVTWVAAFFAIYFWIRKDISG